MHEVSIMGELFEIINENVNRYHLSKVNKVILKIGEFTCVEEGALRFAFEAFSRDTKVESAEMIIEKVKAYGKCNQCGRIFKVAFTNKKCPRCNTFSNHMITGYELLLYGLEGE